MKDKDILIAMDQHDAESWCITTRSPLPCFDVITAAVQLRGLTVDPRRVFFTARASRHVGEDLRDALTTAQKAFLLARPRTADPEPEVRTQAARTEAEKDYTLSVIDPKGRVIFERKVSADQLRELPA